MVKQKKGWKEANAISGDRSIGLPGTFQVADGIFGAFSPSLRPYYFHQTSHHQCGANTVHGIYPIHATIPAPADLLLLLAIALQTSSVLCMLISTSGKLAGITRRASNRRSNRQQRSRTSWVRRICTCRCDQ